MLVTPPIQALDDMAFPRDVPRAHSLGWEGYRTHLKKILGDWDTNVKNWLKIDND